MKIACLGWGSLIWRPENLLIEREWFHDGPLLPIEFARQSENGRLTLVITDTAQPVRTLWALMATTDLPKAILSLRTRESISKKNEDRDIGVIRMKDKTKIPTDKIILDWAISLNLDAVIWTKLPPKFDGKDNRVPSLSEAIAYLQNLEINTRQLAEEYIRKAPKQIDTDYRRKFEREFGWTFLP